MAFTRFFHHTLEILVEVGALQRGWVTFSANFRWKGTSPPTIVDIRKLECVCYLTVKTAWSYLHSSWYNTSVCQTDGWTELPWLIQRCALQAMQPRCKNYNINTVLPNANRPTNWNAIHTHIRHAISPFRRLGWAEQVRSCSEFVMWLPYKLFTSVYIHEMISVFLILSFASKPMF